MPRLSGPIRYSSWSTLPGVAPSDLGAYLIPPGVIGIAFALNLQQVAHQPATSLVFAVALGAIASEALALVVTPKPREA